MTPDQARRRFAEAEVARLATVDPEGRPHLVPVTFALDGDRIVTAIDAKPKSGRELRRVTNIRANDRVALLVDRYDPDWDRLWWARADGTARIVEDEPAARRARVLLQRRYRQYSMVDVSGPLIVVEVDRWSGWQAT